MILGEEKLKNFAAGKDFVVFSTQSGKLFGKGIELYKALESCRLNAVEEDLIFGIDLKIQGEYEIVDIFAAQDAANIWVNVKKPNGNIDTYAAGKETKLLGISIFNNAKVFKKIVLQNDEHFNAPTHFT